MNKIKFLTGLIAISFISFVSFISGAVGQTTQSSLKQATTTEVGLVNLSAAGTVETQQDVLMITLRAIQEGPDGAAVQAQLKTLVDAALQMGRLEAKPGQLAIKSGAFSLQPRYDKDYKPSGWQGTAEVVIDGRDFVKITHLAGRIKGLTIANVNFSLSREEGALSQLAAQKQAIDNFKIKAQSITQQFGFKDYILRDIVVSTGDQGFHPRPQMMAMQVRAAPGASADVPVEAGRAVVSVTIAGNIQMR